MADLATTLAEILKRNTSTRTPTTAKPRPYRPAWTPTAIILLLCEETCSCGTTYQHANTHTLLHSEHPTLGTHKKAVPPEEVLTLYHSLPRRIESFKQTLHYCHNCFLPTEKEPLSNEKEPQPCHVQP